MSRHNTPRAALGRPSAAICGIEPNSIRHRVLLALRATGQMATDQMYSRFTAPSTALAKLEKAGFLTKPGVGRKGEFVRLTPAGRELVRPGGPLDRRHHEIVYCQL